MMKKFGTVSICSLLMAGVLVGCSDTQETQEQESKEVKQEQRVEEQREQEAQESEVLAQEEAQAEQDAQEAEEAQEEVELHPMHMPPAEKAQWENETFADIHERANYLEENPIHLMNVLDDESSREYLNALNDDLQSSGELQTEYILNN